MSMCTATSVSSCLRMPSTICRLPMTVHAYYCCRWMSKSRRAQRAGARKNCPRNNLRTPSETPARWGGRSLLYLHTAVGTARHLETDAVTVFPERRQSIQ
ncbi:unnamed protein product [Ectocarpus fasciculatus]